MSHCELSYVARVLARIETEDPALYRRIIGAGRKTIRKRPTRVESNKRPTP